MSQFNPEMLILARESRGLVQSELGDAVEVQQGTMSKIESGLLSPSAELLDKIANNLRYPRDLFFQEDRVYGFNSTVFFHRKRQSLPDRILRRLHAEMNLTRMRVARLLRSVAISSDRKFQRFDLAEYRGGPEMIAKLVRSTWQIPSGPVRNVIKAIEDAGGVVVATDFGTRQADAISEWVDPCPPVFLINTNPEVTGDRLRLTLAHEIAHITMHRFPGPDMEKEANAFAAEFLMPAREIKPSLYGLTFAKLMDLKAEWRTSMAALIQRAVDLKTITSTQQKYMFMNLGKRGWRMREPEHTDIPLERPSLLNEMIQAHLQQLGYSPDQLAGAVMLLQPDEFREVFLDRKGLRLVG